MTASQEFDSMLRSLNELAQLSDHNNKLVIEILDKLQNYLNALKEQL